MENTRTDEMTIEHLKDIDELTTDDGSVIDEEIAEKSRSVQHIAVWGDPEILGQDKKKKPRNNSKRSSTKVDK